jgi:hypothetical protein
VRVIYGFCLFVVALIGSITFLAFKDIPRDPAEQLAIKLSKAISKEKPLKIKESDLVKKWPNEVAPYFEYEGLTNGEARVPVVKFSDDTNAARHFHMLGYTFSFGDSNEIYLNDRYRNKISTKYQDISALTVLVHETSHIQKGDFSGMDSETIEKNAQLATLEVLASMANHGNKYAKQALLDELLSICLGVIESRAIQSGTLEKYRKFCTEISPRNKIRIEKAERRWNQVGLDKLDELLKKYSVTVYNDFQDFQFTAKAEGDKSPRIMLMDDLKAFLENL